MSERAPRLVIDSSVAVKWFLSQDETHVAEALELLADHLNGTRILAAPAHMTLEVLNELKHRGLGERELTAAATHLLDARIEFHAVESHVADAAALAVRYDLTLYDAAFAALAVELDAELVTADRRLAVSGACRARLLGD